MELKYVLNSENSHSLAPKIPRPPNAFMIYANENRRKMAQLHPQESNKEISKKLGVSWKGLDVSEKKKYFELAKSVDAEHKRKYPDYVYNPKEARIRKAMREASRGIPSPRGTRRLQTWGNPEEQLMMAPSSELGTPLCNTSAFPGPSPGQFMQPMNNYNKLVPVLPSAGWLQDSPTYMQHNPIVELQQHQTNMWQHYPETLRPCTGSGYMVESQLGVYQEVGSEEVMAQKKYKSEGDTFSSNESVIESVLPKSGNDKTVKSEKVEEGKETTEDSRVLLDSNSVEQGNSFVPAFQETVIVQNPFDKDDDVKLKKPQIPLLKRNDMKQSTKALPDFNEAFGSTERGRFQSPPDPRLAPNKGYLDCFFLNNNIKFDDYQI